MYLIEVPLKNKKNYPNLQFLRNQAYDPDPDQGFLFTILLKYTNEGFFDKKNVIYCMS